MCAEFHNSVQFIDSLVEQSNLNGDRAEVQWMTPDEMATLRKIISREDYYSDQKHNKKIKNPPPYDEILHGMGAREVVGKKYVVADVETIEEVLVELTSGGGCGSGDRSGRTHRTINVHLERGDLRTGSVVEAV